MKKAAGAVLLASMAVLGVTAASGCGIGPAHLPALCANRDRLQKLIDDVVDRMTTDRRWWESLSPREKARYREMLEKMHMEEKERALNSIQVLSETLKRLDSRSAEEQGGAGS